MLLYIYDDGSIEKNIYKKIEFIPDEHIKN